MNRLLAPFALGLALTVPALAQTAARKPPSPGSAGSPPAAGAPAAPANPLQKRLEEALDRVDKGDEAGAIQLLEGMRRDPAVTPPVLSLLGGLYLRTNRPKEAMAILKPLADDPNADPAVLFNTGRAALALGQTREGVGYFERSVALAPGSPAARTLGLILAREGEPEHAYEVLRPWALNTPNDTEARLAAALLAINLQRLPEADELLKGLPEGNPRVRLLKGDLALRKGDPKGCIATLRPLVDSPPPGFDTHGGMQLDARRILGEAYLRVGQSAEAVKLLSKVADKGTDSQTALLLAEAQYQGGDIPAALATLSPFAGKILKAEHPRDPDFVVEMALTYGRILTAAGRHQEAANALSVATRLDPEGAAAWQAYGQALVAAGKKDEGAKALARFRDLSAAKAKARLAAQRAGLSPANAPAKPSSDPVLAALQEGQLDKALSLTREQVKSSPKDLKPRAMEVRVLLLLKRYDEALKAAQAMVDLAPGVPDTLYARGVCRLALENPKDAEADFRQALKLQPQYVPAMNDLAVLLMIHGQKAEAKSLLERVIKMRPDDEIANENLRKLKAEGKSGG
jgi:cellulose synthase operon protein C